MSKKFDYIRDSHCDCPDFYVNIFLFFSVRGLNLFDRYKRGIDLFADLEQDRKKVEEHLLFIMQWGHHKGIEGAFEEIFTAIRNYPDWHLEKWDVFRAWYKKEIDYFLDTPDIYAPLRYKDGRLYSKSEDPFYDPDAPDWEQYEDREHKDGCKDDTDRDDDKYIEAIDRPGDAAIDGLLFGIGFGAAFCTGFTTSSTHSFLSRSSV